jgi:hypothetical protein
MPDNSPGEHDQLNASWQQNLPLLIGLLSLGFIAVRLLGVAGGDPETAYAILQAEGTASVAVGTLIPAAGLIIFGIGIVLISYSFRYRRKKNTLAAAFLLVAAVAALEMAIITAPAIALLTSIGATAFFVFFSVLVHTTRTGRKDSLKDELKDIDSKTFLFGVTAIYSICVLAFMVLYSIPWVPTQNIAIKGRASFSAFVLAQNNTTTFILTQNPIEVIQLPSDRIISQEVCKTPDFTINEETINQLLGNPFTAGAHSASSYPRCGRGYFNS